jgi:hypothetical protein
MPIHATTTNHAMTTTPANDQTTPRHSFIRSTRPAHVVERDDVFALRASQLANVAADEIEWFFTTTTTTDDGPAVQARATIADWLGELTTEEQRALALRYDPAPWPESLQASGLESGYALALSLVSTKPWRPSTRVHHEPHRRAGDHLETAVRERGLGVMRGIHRRASWDFASAVRAYANVRGRTPSVLPLDAA